MIIARRLRRPPENALDPRELSSVRDRRSLRNANPAAAVRQDRAGTDHKAADASHVAAGRKTAAAIAERLARRLTEVEMQPIVRRPHHRDGRREDAMASGQSLEGAHAIAAVAMPVEIDHQEPVGAAGDRRQCIWRAAPPLGNDFALGGGDLLPLLEQRTLVGAGGKYLHTGCG